MNKRIRELRKALGLSQRIFAEKIGLKQNAISYMEKEGSTVTEQNIRAICNQFSVDEKWLRFGEGNMFLDDEKKAQELFEIFSALSPLLQDYLIKTARDLLEAQQKMRSSDRLGM